MFEWIGNAVDAVVDFVTGGGDPPPEPDPCDEGACGAARAARAGARSSVENMCYNTKIVLLVFRTAVRAVTLPLVVYITLLIVAFLVAGPFGILIAVGVYLFLLLFLRAWAPVVEAALRGLAATYSAEAQAIAQVVSDCPPECQGDTDATPCDLGVGGSEIPTTPFDAWLGLDRRFGRG